jgi:folate-dependent phosphoribosylglycinamide formyltransferase PurN
MQERDPSRIVVMTAGGLGPCVMINALARHFSDIHVIQEHPESKRAILKRRARRFGWPHALGQLATTVAARLGKKVGARRSAEIIAQYGHSSEIDPSISLTQVTSLNDQASHNLLRQLQPAAVFTISCRILSPATLAATPCPIINFHAGINPTYRGQMGGYWARVEGDEKNFGATLHLVDAGTDTGGTLLEHRLAPSRSDTMSTYPLLITAASTDASVRVLQDAVAGNLRPYDPAGTSILRFPPPVWTWLYHGLTKRIW